MNDAILRRLERLERENDILRQRIERLSGARNSGIAPTHCQILQANADIDARDAAGSDFTVYYGPATLWDLAIDSLSSSGGSLTMKEVDRNVLLANPWGQDSTDGSFIIGTPYKSIYLPASEECEE